MFLKFLQSSKFLIFLIVPILYCCTQNAPINNIEKFLIKNYKGNKSSTIIIISDTDCSSCLEFINPKLKNLNKPIIGIYLRSYEKSNISFTNWMNNNSNIIKWNELKDISLANDLNSLWANAPGPCYFEFRNSKIVKYNKL